MAHPEAATFAEYEPAPHKVQLVWIPREKEPDGQILGLEVVEAQAYPGGHTEHAD